MNTTLCIKREHGKVGVGFTDVKFIVGSKGTVFVMVSCHDIHLGSARLSAEDADALAAIAQQAKDARARSEDT